LLKENIMLKRNFTFALLFLLMIPVMVSAQSAKRQLVHRAPLAKIETTSVVNPNYKPGSVQADGNYIAVDTMNNGLGPSISTINPVAFDPYSGVVTWFHRGYTATYAAGSGQLWYNISTDFGLTWSRVPNGVNTTNSQIFGRYPSMGLSNPAKGPIAATTAFFSWPELIAGAFGGIGYAADQPAGSGAGAAFLDMGSDPNLYSSQTTCWASDNTADMFWTADYFTSQPGGAGADLWSTPDFGTIHKSSPPQWSDTVFSSVGQIMLGGQAWQGVQYYGALGTFNEFYAPNPIHFGWFPGVSKSTDNGATWSNFKVCDFRTIAKVAQYDELYNWSADDAAFRLEGDINVDKNGHAHILVEVADTSTDYYTYNSVAILDLFETNTGWDATVVTRDLDTRPVDNLWNNAVGMGLAQMGPSPYLAFDSTRNVMAVQYTNVGPSGYLDVFLKYKHLADTVWSAPINLTHSDSTNNGQTHLAPFLRTVSNGTYTAFSYYGYELGVTGPLGNANNATVGYMGAETFSVTGINDPVNTVNSFSLAQNYPNPFNPSTKIDYSLTSKSNVSLKVYDMLGRQVANLVNATQEAGNHSINFNASKLASGLYIYTLKSGNNVMSKKMMLLK
jgi:hypothetical protein